MVARIYLLGLIISSIALGFWSNEPSAGFFFCGIGLIILAIGYKIDI